jgi:hypothetical protein
MAEQVNEVEVMVLNDLAWVGDRVAIAVSAGRYGAGMRTGTILEIRRTGPEYAVKVRVEQTSGYNFGPMPYVKTFDAPKRMVKLGSMTDAL